MLKHARIEECEHRTEQRMSAVFNLHIGPKRCLPFLLHRVTTTGVMEGVKKVKKVVNGSADSRGERESTA